MLTDTSVNDYDTKDAIHGALFNNLEVIDGCNLLMYILEHIEDVMAREYDPTYEGSIEYLEPIGNLLRNCEETAWLVVYNK